MPTLYISPNLGWASSARMLDPNYNPLAQAIDYGVLVATPLPDIGYISSSYRVISPGGVTYLLPSSVVDKFIGTDIEYVYKSSGDTVPKKTILRKTTLGILADEE